jgi:hypothetical protein
MVTTTREQRRALKRIYARIEQTDAYAGIMTYRQFRKTVAPTFGCDGAVTVPWCGMWLCIERDGYTHS